jgi:isoaspartyl peptidase/L-asparaginase-like protein (Ntn-hydrolase superfamily)
MPNVPIVVSTWKHGLAANKAAWKTLNSGGAALDAVEHGVRVSEDDPSVMSVGYGGLPDDTGRVTLDAAIMDHRGNAGAVAFLEHIKNPISVARLVMERTRHMILVGEGALEFALANGFEKTDLLTEKARKKWLKWKTLSDKSKWHPPMPNEEDHDTIGMVAIDRLGNLAGSCTTSGLGFKMRGRVGDSPIIGSGLYVNNEVGAAVATGNGEEVIRVCASFLTVEKMREGLDPQQACEIAIRRMIKTSPKTDFQVGVIALSKDGAIGGASVRKGFQYAVYCEGKDQLLDAIFFL